MHHLHVNEGDTSSHVVVVVPAVVAVDHGQDVEVLELTIENFMARTDSLISRVLLFQSDVSRSKIKHRFSALVEVAAVRVHKLVLLEAMNQFFFEYTVV